MSYHKLNRLVVKNIVYSFNISLYVCTIFKLPDFALQQHKKQYRKKLNDCKKQLLNVINGIIFYKISWDKNVLICTYIELL